MRASLRGCGKRATYEGARLDERGEVDEVGGAPGQQVALVHVGGGVHVLRTARAHQRRHGEGVGRAAFRQAHAPVQPERLLAGVGRELGHA